MGGGGQVGFSKTCFQILATSLMPRGRRKVNFLGTSLSKISNVHLRNLLKKEFLLKVGVTMLPTWESPSQGLGFFIYTMSGLDKMHS